MQKIYFYLFVYLFLYLIFYLFVYIHTYLFVNIYLFVYLHTYIFIVLLTYLCILNWVILLIYLFTYLENQILVKLICGPQLTNPESGTDKLTDGRYLSLSLLRSIIHQTLLSSSLCADDFLLHNGGIFREV